MNSDLIAILALIVAVITLAVTVVSLLTWQDHAQFLKTDPQERERRIRELRGGSFGQLYPVLLERGLTWLDLRFGSAFSSSALNVCTLLALCYAFVFFYIAYALEAPGGLGDSNIWIPAETDAPTRLIIAGAGVLVPPLMFFVSRWLSRILGRWERRLKLVIRRRYRLRATRFEIAYRSLLALVVGSSVLYIYTGEDAIFFPFYGMLAFIPFIGAFAGEFTAKRVALPWLKSPLSVIAGAVAGAVAYAVAGAVAVVDAVAVVVAGAVAYAGAGAVAGAGVVAFAVEFTFASAVPIGDARSVDLAGIVFDVVPVAFVNAVVYAVVGAAAVAVAIGTLIGVRGKRLNSWRGLIAGSIGTVLGVGAMIAVNNFADDAAIALITFFLALPIVNGLWDFGSWWVSRTLGRHLLTTLNNQSPGARQGWTIFWHIALDVLLAMLFLLTLAWFLGFAFECYHNIARWSDAGQVGALPGLAGDIQRAAADPFGKGLWLSAMLLSTLIPTLLHGTIAIAGMLTLFSPMTAYRSALADTLGALNQQDESTQALTLQRTGRYLANVRPLIWLAACVLLLVLLWFLWTVVAMIHNGGFADYVSTAALWGVGFSDWLFGYQG